MSLAKKLSASLCAAALLFASAACTSSDNSRATVTVTETSLDIATYTEYDTPDENPDATFPSMHEAPNDTEAPSSLPTSIVTPPPPLKPPATTVQPSVNSDDQKELTEYLNNPERKELYRANFTPAALRVAIELNKGTFGPVQRYNSYKLPLKGEVGWGGIGTVDGANVVAYAGVWFEANGGIDFKKGVQWMILDPGEDALGINIDSPYGNNKIWYSFLDTTVDSTGPVRVTTTSPYEAGTETDYEMANTVEKSTDLDRDVILALRDDMDMLFGAGWNN
jgi:hypothetical protein